MAAARDVERVCELGRKAGIPRHVILDAIEAGRAAVRAQPFYRAADAAKYFTPPALLEYARQA